MTSERVGGTSQTVRHAYKAVPSRLQFRNGVPENLVHGCIYKLLASQLMLKAAVIHVDMNQAYPRFRG